MAFAAPAAGAAARGAASKVASGAGQAAAQAATVKANTKKVVKASKNVSGNTRSTTRNIISNSKRSWEPRSVGGYRRIITALFVLSALIVIYKNSKNEGWSSAQSWRRLGAVWFVYFVFGIASTAGIKVARICALLGGLITLALLIQNKDLLFGATSALRGFGGTPAGTDQDSSGIISGTAGGGGGGGGGGSWGSGTGAVSTPNTNTQPLYVNGQITDRTKVFLTETNTPANVPTATSNPGGTPNVTTTDTPVSFGPISFSMTGISKTGTKIGNATVYSSIPQSDVDAAKKAKKYFAGNWITGTTVKIPNPVSGGYYFDNGSGWGWMVK